MSHVVVFNASAKSVRIPTTPTKYLTEVRDEACQKLSMSKENYTLKYNNKPVSLSQQIRLANLAQGARLELVQASRSPTVITVALQLPNSRLTKKLPNNISLWEILRQFESDQGANHNFTQRGVPAMISNGTSGAGRLNYEMPVITVLPDHRKYATFVGLQKTLSQLGFDSGSALLKLSYENSGQPLEEAMNQISQYFKSAEPAASGAPAPSSAPSSATAAPATAAAAPGETSEPKESAPSLMDIDEKAPEPAQLENVAPPTSIPSGAVVPPPTNVSAPPSSITPSEPVPFSRNIHIFAPSTSDTPQAARYAHNESDYIPTVEHAKSHQASLNDRSRNTRLLSDKELEEQERTRQEKLKAAAERGGKVRLRFPDGTLVEANISKTDTAQDLFDLVTSLLDRTSEPYQLLRRDLQNPSRMTPLSRDSKLLFQDLALWNSEMVTFRWDEAASAETRGIKNVLSREWQQKAEALKVEEPTAVAAQEKGQGQATGKAEGKRKVEMSAEEKEHKLKNILKGGIFGKKK